MLIFHNTVRSIRKDHRDAILAILYSIFQTLVMVGAFYILMDMLGLRSLAIRGDFLLYVMSGNFVFMTHVKSVSAVMGSEDSTSPMMQHLPMNTRISIWASAFSALYIQIVSIGSILVVYHLVWTPIEVHQPVGAVAMLASCVVFRRCGRKRVFGDQAVDTGADRRSSADLYRAPTCLRRAKCSWPTRLQHKWWRSSTWNPLFHIIDQGRGYIFVNYNPRNHH